VLALTAGLRTKGPTIQLRTRESATWRQRLRVRRICGRRSYCTTESAYVLIMYAPFVRIGHIMTSNPTTMATVS